MRGLTLAARTLAIAIAIVGVIDPSFTSLRSGRPDIAIVSTSRNDSTLARQLADRLDGDFTVVRGAWDGASATVIAGSELPARIPSGRIFAVRDTARVAIAEFSVPAAATTEASSEIGVAWRQHPDIEVRADGLVVGQISANPSTDATRFSYTPASPGVVHFQARARAGDDLVTADAIMSVVDRPHAVLFFDRRPSWMSTFVRRSLEQDRRFAVASRVITSRGVSTDAGQPPSTLADPAVLELYDVIVVGAPTALTAADVAGLETFLRRRGGSAVLLFDTPVIPSNARDPHPDLDGPHRRLTGVARWSGTTLRTPSDGALRVTEAIWPISLPVGSETRLSMRTSTQDRPLVWTAPLGPGQVIVSGAVDAWKLRDPSTSQFDDFWRATISRAAREAEDAIAIHVTPNVAEPGERMTVRITLSDTAAVPSAVLDSTAIRLWPGERAGELVGEFRAPAVGVHTVRASVAGARAEAPVLVRERVTRVAQDDSRVLGILARASGGTVGTVDEIQQAIRQSVVAERRPETWWLMRSGWWIVPFVGLLGLEWLVRRRRGLA